MQAMGPGPEPPQWERKSRREKPADSAEGAQASFPTGSRKGQSRGMQCLGGPSRSLGEL